MLIINARRALMGAVWFIVIWRGSRMLVGGVIGGFAGTGKGVAGGYEAGRAASAAFFNEYGWLFLPLTSIILAALFGYLPGTKPTNQNQPAES